MAKKRAHGEGSIYQLGDGRWRAALSGEGGRRTVSPRCATQRQARAWLDAAKAKRAAGVVASSGRQTVGAWLDAWLQTHVRGSVRPRTYESYESHVRVHLKPMLGHHRLDALAAGHVRDLLDGLAAKGLDSDSSRRILVVLRRALGEAMGEGRIERNVAKLVRAPKLSPKRVDPPSPETMLALIEAARGHRIMEAFVPLAVATGLRHGELLALTWDRLQLGDRENGVVTVAQTMHRRPGAGLEARETKTDASRKSLYLPASIVDVLVQHRARQGRDRLAAGADWQDHNLVFAGVRGGPIDGTNNLKVFHRLQDRAGLPRCRIHDLRHAYVTYLLAMGVDMRTIMELARHGSIHVTMNTYAHVMPAAGRKAAGRMDDLLTGRTGLDDDGIATSEATGGGK